MTSKQILAQLKGIFPPVVTPFDRRGEVDEGRFRENLRKYAGVGLGGIVVTGSTGEAPYLTERERLRLVELAREIVKPPEVMIVGTGLESTRETLRLSREVIARGADALLVVTPNYYKSKMDATALSAHYRALADGVRRPVLIYSIPQFTGVHIDAATIGVLSRHPNIAGLKESSGNLAFVREVLRKVKPSFRVLVGSVRKTRHLQRDLNLLPEPEHRTLGTAHGGALDGKQLYPLHACAEVECVFPRLPLPFRARGAVL